VALSRVSIFGSERMSLATGREMTLIAVTGCGQAEDKRRAQASGFDHHLTKPVDPNSLEALISTSGSAAPDDKQPR
jgi:CheY-like chemotaxis protein